MRGQGVRCVLAVVVSVASGGGGIGGPRVSPTAWSYDGVGSLSSSGGRGSSRDFSMDRGGGALLGVGGRRIEESTDRLGGNGAGLGSVANAAMVSESSIARAGGTGATSRDLLDLGSGGSGDGHSVGLDISKDDDRGGGFLTGMLGSGLSL
ncbi:hypothetical protein HK101_006771 [Irineochytrium annulatum]|nr:hypothetical protein HK101_006771 [Irineochytrium annulatum]